MAKAQPALLLAIDCSNTGIKFGLYPHESDELRARWRVATVREKTVDEYAALLASLCQQAGLRMEDIGDVILASVVPPSRPSFRRSPASISAARRSSSPTSSIWVSGCWSITRGRPAPTG